MGALNSHMSTTDVLLSEVTEKQKIAKSTEKRSVGKNYTKRWRHVYFPNKKVLKHKFKYKKFHEMDNFKLRTYTLGLYSWRQK